MDHVTFPCKGDIYGTQDGYQSPWTWVVMCKKHKYLKTDVPSWDIALDLLIIHQKSVAERAAKKK